jgi:hypothetical protein
MQTYLRLYCNNNIYVPQFCLVLISELIPSVPRTWYLYKAEIVGMYVYVHVRL